MRIEANHQDMFRRIDADGDGKITKDEMKAGAPKGAPEGEGAARAMGEHASRRPSLDELFSQIDADGDGGISTEENEAFIQARGAERQGRRDPAAVASHLFRKADGDGDGSVSKTDLLAALPKGADASLIDKLFSDADGDEDGVISEAELKTSIEKQLQAGRGYDASGQVTSLSAASTSRSFVA